MDKAFMGVSIRNPFYSKKENILRAIDMAKKFDEFLIFVVDSPYKLSLQAFKDIPEKDAEGIILKEGEKLKSFLTGVSESFGNVKVHSWKELEGEEYKNMFNEIKNLEKNDKQFSKLIEGEFTGTVVSKIKNDEKKKKMSKEFIMQEIAMFISLIEKGYKTRISKYSKSKSIDYFLKGRDILINHIQI